MEQGGKSVATQLETNRDCNIPALAGKTIRAHQTRRQQTRRALSVVDQDLAGGEVGAVELSRW
jgi:hypothetical protein